MSKKKSTPSKKAAPAKGGGKSKPVAKKPVKKAAKKATKKATKKPAKKAAAKKAASVNLPDLEPVEISN